MAVNFTLLCRAASDQAVQSTLDVDLVVDYPAALAATYNMTNNGDGSYTIDIDTDIGGTCRGTVNVNGVPQSEFTDMLFVGQDMLDHLGQASYGGAADSAALHGLDGSDGDILGEYSTAPDVQNKTITHASNDISAALLTSGTLDMDRIAALAIADSKLAQITTADKVAGSAVEVSSVEDPCLDDSTGMYVLTKSTGGIVRTATGLSLDLNTVAFDSSGLVMDADGVYVDAATNGGLELVAGGLQVDPDIAPWAMGLWRSAAAKVSNYPPWEEPQNFGTSVSVLTAIQTLDNRVWDLLISSEDKYDKRALCVFSQGNVNFASNTGADTFDDADTLALSDGDTGIGRLKMMYPVFKSPTVSTICVRGQFNNVDAGETTTLTIKVKDSSGSVKHTAEDTVIGTSWAYFNANISMNTFADGVYSVEVWLKTSDSSYNAQMRGTIIMISSYTWATFEIGNSAVWETAAFAEDDEDIV